MIRLLALVLLTSHLTSAVAQEVAKNEVGQPPVISDEPTSVDPATLMPEVLANKATVVFGGSIQELAEWLSREHQIPTVVDRAALDEFGMTDQEQIFEKLTDEPLYLLLDRLRVSDLDWYYEDELVTITTQESADIKLATAPYNLSDLLDQGFDREALLNVIFCTISPETWANNGGGEAEMRWIGDVLFVSQTQRVHLQIKGLFQALRKHGRQTFIYEMPQHADLRTKLEEPLNVRLDNTPLAKAVEKIAEVADLNLRLDTQALEEFGIDGSDTISVRVRNRSLRVALKSALRELELTTMLRDGVLWITTEEEAESYLKTAVYDVRDLCRDAQESEALTDAVISQVAAETWAENGGGESEICYAKPGVMVVAQTERMHQELITLLERYRMALRQSKPRAEKKLDPKEVLTHYYRLPREMANSLPRVLQQLVDHDSWQAHGFPQGVGTILVVESVDEVTYSNSAEPRAVPHSVLIVQQTRENHKAISNLITKIRSGDAPQSQGGGGFGGGGSFGGQGGFGNSFLPQQAE